MDRRGLIKALIAAGLVSPTALQAALRTDFKYLVLVELTGANDGLNTLAPFESDAYHRLRPTLKLATDQIIRVGESPIVGPLGLNVELAKLVDEGWGQDIAAVMGLGYPAPNRSHFSSIALWETGGDGLQVGNRGWVTDTLERLYPGQQRIHGVTLSQSMGLFKSGRGVYTSIANLNQLKGYQPVSMQATDNPLLQLMAQRRSDLSLASRTIRETLESYGASRLPLQPRYNPLGNQLRDVMRIIGAELPIPVLHLQHGSYDTHKSQKYRHRSLLRDLGENLSLFSRGLKQMGRWDDVLVVTYCEFGRRALENANGGTDHGTANTHFVMGGRVNPGVYGRHPSLTELVNSDMQHTLDYRGLYDRICTQWFEDPLERWQPYREPDLSGLIRARS